MCTLTFHRRPAAWVVALMVGAGVLLTACDTSIEPFRNEQAPFSLFGEIDVTVPLFTSSVRVERLRDGVPLGANFNDRIEATLTDSVTGVVREVPVRRDTVENRQVFNLEIPNQLAPGRDYGLFVQEQESGQTARTTFRTPSRRPEIVSVDTMSTCLERTDGGAGEIVQPRPFKVRLSIDEADRFSDFSVVYFWSGDDYVFRKLQNVYVDDESPGEIVVEVNPDRDLECFAYRSLEPCPSSRPSVVPSFILMQVGATNLGWPGPEFVLGNVEVRASPELSTVDEGLGVVYSAAYDRKIIYTRRANDRTPSDNCGAVDLPAGGVSTSGALDTRALPSAPVSPDPATGTPAQRMDAAVVNR